MSTVDMIVYLIQRGKLSIDRVAEQYKSEVEVILQESMSSGSQNAV